MLLSPPSFCKQPFTRSLRAGQSVRGRCGGLGGRSRTRSQVSASEAGHFAHLSRAMGVEDVRKLERDFGCTLVVEAGTDPVANLHHEGHEGTLNGNPKQGTPRLS